MSGATGPGRVDKSRTSADASSRKKSALVVEHARAGPGPHAGPGPSHARRPGSRRNSSNGSPPGVVRRRGGGRRVRGVVGGAVDPIPPGAPRAGTHTGARRIVGASVRARVGDSGPGPRALEPVQRAAQPSRCPGRRVARDRCRRVVAMARLAMMRLVPGRMSVRAAQHHAFTPVIASVCVRRSSRRSPVACVADPIHAVRAGCCPRPAGVSVLALVGASRTTMNPEGRTPATGSGCATQIAGLLVHAHAVLPPRGRASPSEESQSQGRGQFSQKCQRWVGVRESPLSLQQLNARCQHGSPTRGLAGARFANSGAPSAPDGGEEPRVARLRSCRRHPTCRGRRITCTCACNLGCVCTLVALIGSWSGRLREGLADDAQVRPIRPLFVRA